MNDFNCNNDKNSYILYKPEKAETYLNEFMARVEKNPLEKIIMSSDAKKLRSSDLIYQLLKNIKPCPVSNVELGKGVLGSVNINNVLCYLDTIGGKDREEILYHELLHILYPEKDEAWVREQTLKSGYSRFHLPIVNYD